MRGVETRRDVTRREKVRRDVWNVAVMRFDRLRRVRRGNAGDSARTGSSQRVQPQASHGAAASAEAPRRPAQWLRSAASGPRRPASPAAPHGCPPAPLHRAPQGTPTLARTADEPRKMAAALHACDCKHLRATTPSPHNALTSCFVKKRRRNILLDASCQSNHRNHPVIHS